MHNKPLPYPIGTRSTKAGVETPATRLALYPDRTISVAAQQRPESKLRRHTHSPMCSPRAPAIAQQRPESKLRRHDVGLRHVLVVRHRSTKAGVETPATRAVHIAVVDAPGALNKGRSRNSGDTRPWARRLGRQAWSLNKGRSRNSGDTPPTAPRRNTRSWPLNKGRSRNSGDTCRHRPAPRHRHPLNKGRSRNSGDTSKRQGGSARMARAQQRPESKLRRHRSRTILARDIAYSLNKGRSRNSGDTRPDRQGTCRGADSLNKGRSRNSGDTLRSGCFARRSRPSLNKGRSRNSGDTTAQPFDGLGA